MGPTQSLARRALGYGRYVAGMSLCLWLARQMQLVPLIMSFRSSEREDGALKTLGSRPAESELAEIERDHLGEDRWIHEQTKETKTWPMFTSPCARQRWCSRATKCIDVKGQLVVVLLPQ
jgi:hypothetical protein